MALSVLGYRCCSDLESLPRCELEALCGGKSSRIFDAYVNVGGLSDVLLREIALANPDIRFIFTSPHTAEAIPDDVSRQALLLREDGTDFWEPLSRFLDVEYPAFPYPHSHDTGQRSGNVSGEVGKSFPPSTCPEWDAAPWIVPSVGWPGIQLSQPDGESATEHECERFDHGIGTMFRLRTDTFPSNRALFRRENCRTIESGGAEITLRRESQEVRDYTAAALCSVRRYRYGKFAAVLRPSGVPGIITGFFLHRNGPRQEIDIEFMGDDTTRMLVNVFYNPGSEGTKLEYGYRGTPTILDLGFDAARDFHVYEIEWRSTALIWRVDGKMVHRRALWQPTPIPHLPMELNLNIWLSRSIELAGVLDDHQLPASSFVREVRIANTEEP